MDQSESGGEEPREWIFTFGHGQLWFPGYVRIFGTFADARSRMVAIFGVKWSMQYESKEAAQVDKWNLPDHSERFGL